MDQSQRTGSARFAHSRRPTPAVLEAGAHRPERLTERGQEVLDGLEALFLREGFSQFTAGELASRLNCSRRTLYEIAPSKDELAVLVVDRLLHRAGKLAHDRASRERHRIDQLAVYLETVATVLGDMSIEFSRDMQRLPAASRVFDGHVTYSASVIEALIEQGVQEGEFEPVHAPFVAELIVGGLRLLQDPTRVESTGLTLSQGIHELASVFGRGLLARRRPAKAV